MIVETRPNLFATRILLIEDEHFMRNLVIQALNSVGFATIHEAESGRHALQILDKQDVDIVITDIEMKHVNGFDVVRAIREGETRLARNAPVIFLSGLSDVATLASAARLDAQGFLIKPVSAKQLLEKVKAAMEAEVVVHPVGTYRGMTLDTAGHQGSAGPRSVPGSDPHAVAASRVGIPGHDRASPANNARLDVLMLTEGMTLRHNVYVRGVLLLAQGTPLRSPQIKVLQDMRLLLDDRQIEVDLPPGGG